MNALCVLYRQPVPGTGKTRLRAGLRSALVDPSDADGAADLLYRAFLTDLQERTDGFNGSVFAFVAGAGSENPFWPGSLRQARGDLGRRMAYALETAFADGAERALLIGSDAPWLDVSFLHRCLQHLDSTGAVLGPSVDGGYFLIGFRASDYTPEVFDLAEWGHERVLQQTRERLISAAVTVTETEMGIDFDELSDLRIYFDRPGAGDTLPHTRAVYQSLIWRIGNET